MKLFDKIRILRKARGLSQEQLGYSLSRVNKDGISRQTISDWENGKFEPKLDNIRDLAEVFNVSFDALLDEDVDLDNEQVLQAVLNQQSYKKVKEEPKEEVAPVVETTKENKNMISVRNAILLFVTIAILTFSLSMFVGSVTDLIIISTSASPLLIMEVIAGFVIMALGGVSLGLLIHTLAKKRKPNAPVVLLIIAIGIYTLFYIGFFAVSMGNYYASYKQYKDEFYLRIIWTYIFDIVFMLIRNLALLAAVIIAVKVFDRPRPVEE